MEFLTGLPSYLWTFLTYVLPFLFVLGIVVFVHEMGHFLVARFFSVTVEAFPSVSDRSFTPSTTGMAQDGALPPSRLAVT